MLPRSAAVSAMAASRMPSRQSRSELAAFAQRAPIAWRIAIASTPDLGEATDTPLGSDAGMGCGMLPFRLQRQVRTSARRTAWNRTPVGPKTAPGLTLTFHPGGPDNHEVTKTMEALADFSM